MKKRLSKSLYTPEWEALCLILRRLREAKGITQIALSNTLKQPQSFVSKVESGQRKLDLRQFVIYVRGLDADPVQIFRRYLQDFDVAESASPKPRRK